MTAIRTDLATPPAPHVGVAGASLDQQWDALCEAAEAVAAIAGITGSQPADHLAALPAAIHQASGWRHSMAIDAVADMTAMMTPGLRALLTVSDRGQDPRPAALCLWREYRHACDALAGLVAAAHPE